MKKTYSIVMIGYKSLDNIKNRVNEVFLGSNPPDEFILIINYYSEDSFNILEYAKNDKRITRYIFCSQNIGYAKAINLGCSISTTDNIIILNDDCKINQDTCFSLSEMLIDNYGLSTILIGGNYNDTISIPQGFILGIKRDSINQIGGYVYDEIASPLGCERELTYRLKVNGYELINDNTLFFQHIHDISNNPTTVINYLGKNVVPQGANGFQNYTTPALEEKINTHKFSLKQKN
jgi:hypothetical protein